MTKVLDDLARDIARQLASARMDGDTAIIETPLQYIGGAGVVVRVQPVAGEYFVSDADFAYRECILLGGERAFAKAGFLVASRLGIDFDRRSFFVRSVSADKLVDAIISVANASVAAVERVSVRLEDRISSVSPLRSELTDKLQKAFGKELVVMGAKVRGASKDEWTFDASVRIGEQLSLFQIVKPNMRSVYEAVASFIDMTDLQMSRPALVAVLQDRAQTPRLRLVERSASTIELSAALESWHSLAA